MHIPLTRSEVDPHQRRRAQVVFSDEHLPEFHDDDGGPAPSRSSADRAYGRTVSQQPSPGLEGVALRRP